MSKNCNQTAPQQTKPEESNESALQSKITELEGKLSQSRAGNSTLRKIATWYIRDYPLFKISNPLFGLSDICDPAELNQVVDYHKSVMDDRDGGLVESYRATIVDMATTRVRKEEVKRDTLAEMAAS